MLDDLFFEEAEVPKELDKKDKITKVTKEEVLEGLYEKAKSRKRKIKTSVFSSLEGKILTQISNLIMKKELSYRSALDKLKLIYPDNTSIQNKRSESLRYLLIKKGYVTNEKALKTIHKSISNSEYARSKRVRIIEDVVEEIFTTHLDIVIERILENEKFKETLRKLLL